MGLLVVFVALQSARVKEERQPPVVQSFAADVALNAMIAVRYGAARVPGGGYLLTSLDSTANQGYLLLTAAPKPGEEVQPEEVEIPYLRLASLHLLMGRREAARATLEQARRTVSRRSKWRVAPLVEGALFEKSAEDGRAFMRWQRAHQRNLTGLFLAQEVALATGDQVHASEYATLLRERAVGTLKLVLPLGMAGLGLLALGLLAWVWILARWRTTGWAGTGKSGVLAGGIWSAFEIVVVLAFSQALVSFLLGLLLRALPGGAAPTRQPHELVVLLAGAYIGAAVLTALYVLNVMYPWQRVHAEDVGLVRTRVSRAFGWGLPWMFALALAVQVVGVFWMPLVRGEPLWHPVMEALAERQPLWAMISLLALGIVVAPFVEEVIFRGFVYPRFRAHLRAGYAMLLNGALFALLHMSAIAFLPVLVLGAGLCALYEKSGSVWPCVVCHGAFNAMQFAMVFGAMRVAAA